MITARPGCKFISCNLNTRLPRVDSVDTVFCFSIDKYENKTQLVETIFEKTRRMLYFEGSEELAERIIAIC